MKLNTSAIFDHWEKVIKIYPNGLLQKRGGTRPPGVPAVAPGVVRGNITRFSRHSALRLRSALLTRSCDPSSRAVSVGITLTLPWILDFAFNQSILERDYRIAFDRFCKSIRRRFPSSAAIFRHELQRRRAPHCHIVFYLSRFDFDLRSRGRSANLSIFRDLVFSLWLRALDGSQPDYPVSSRFAYRYNQNIAAFAKRGVVVSYLSSNIASYRYICDHASKHKRSQLGYRGKQWGFINRALLVPEKPIDIDFTSPVERLNFVRHIGRVIRFRVPSFNAKKLHRSSGSKKPLALPDDVFLCKLSKPLAGRSVVFVSSRTSKQLAEWIAGNRPPGFLV